MPSSFVHPRRRSVGFTLIELVVVIILLGVLAAVAVPKYVELGRTARVAAVTAMASTLQSAALHIRAVCKIDPTCNYEIGQEIHIGGQDLAFLFGWPEAGDTVGVDQIDVLVTTEGFHVTLPDNLKTRFALDDAPDPASCSATYQQALSPTIDATVTTALTGC